MQPLAAKAPALGRGRGSHHGWDGHGQGGYGRDGPRNRYGQWGDYGYDAYGEGQHRGSSSIEASTGTMAAIQDVNFRARPAILLKVSLAPMNVSGEVIGEAREGVGGAHLHRGSIRRHHRRPRTRPPRPRGRCQTTQPMRRRPQLLCLRWW